MPVTPISSRSNPWFKRFHLALERHDDEILIEGPKQVADAIAAGWQPIAVASSVEHSLPRSVMALEFTPALLKGLSDTIHPQGTVGLFHRPVRTAAEVFGNPRSIVVCLDGVQDPGNVGTIIRLAAAFDAAGVVLAGDCADPFGPKSVRASAGAILSVPVVSLPRRALLEEAAAHHFSIYATASGSDATFDVPPAAGVIVFGSEGRGVSAELLEAAERIAIPMSKNVESLNVATAAAIVLHRSFQRRQTHIP